MNTNTIFSLYHGWIDRGDRGSVSPPSGKPKEPIGFLRNTGLDPHPLEKQLDPLVQLLLQGGSISPL